jgi:hypothetical protein
MAFLKYFRDIVQFVPFRKFQHDPQELARQTLDEIPRQLLDYMKQHKIRPLPKIGENIQQLQKIKPTDEDDYFSNERKRFTETLMKMGYRKDKVKCLL